MLMKNKKLVFGVLSAIALAGVTSAGLASAHGFGMFSKATPEEIATQQTVRFEGEAKLLGIGVDEVKNAWAEGKSIKDIAKEKGITDEQLRAKIQAEASVRMKAHMQTLVDKGVITQVQADARLKFMQDRVANGGEMGKKGMGMRGHMF